MPLHEGLAGHSLLVEGEGGKCVSPFSLHTSHYPYANGRCWSKPQTFTPAIPT